MYYSYQCRIHQNKDGAATLDMRVTLLQAKVFFAIFNYKTGKFLGIEELINPFLAVAYLT